VQLAASGSTATVNGKPLAQYFPYFEHQQQVREPLVVTGRESIGFTAVVRGGGVRGQAEAVRLGIARALVAGDEGLRTMLRAAGLLTRDSRAKERKKYGLRRARRAPQWQKR
jgi:small subunit ribosomal protein S9